VTSQIVQVVSMLLVPMVLGSASLQSKLVSGLQYSCCPLSSVFCDSSASSCVRVCVCVVRSLSVDVRQYDVVCHVSILFVYCCRVKQRC
jgi:hypothetical protein